MKTLLAIMLAALTATVAAQGGFVERVQQREFEVLRKGTCERLLDDLEDRITSDFAAMTCSLSRMVDTVVGERVVKWIISLDFPGGYRERLDKPVRIGGQWEHYGNAVYDPAWALLQGQYTYDYIEAERRQYVHYEPDQWVIWLNQYWYNRKRPQPRWYEGTAAPGGKVEWELLPGGEQQVRELKAQAEWRERYRRENDGKRR